jgi:hypothetical protein
MSRRLRRPSAVFVSAAAALHFSALDRQRLIFSYSSSFCVGMDQVKSGKDAGPSRPPGLFVSDECLRATVLIRSSPGMRFGAVNAAKKPGVPPGLSHLDAGDPIPSQGVLDPDASLDLMGHALHSIMFSPL